MSHPTKFVPSLNAEIDAEVWTLVKAINGFGFKTVSSCQGGPNWGHVAFVSGESPFDYTRVAEFCFKFLYSFFAHMHDCVGLQVSSGKDGFTGWLQFDPKALDEVTRRLYVYRENEGR
jgi:hypothetical protein